MIEKLNLVLQSSLSYIIDLIDFLVFTIIMDIFLFFGVSSIVEVSFVAVGAFFVVVITDYIKNKE